MGSSITAMTTALGMGPLPSLVEEMAGHRALERVFAAQGLPLALVEHPGMHVPFASLAGLFDRAARETGDRAFGLRVGETMTHRGYGAWARYIGAAPRLGAALRRAGETVWMHQSGSRFELAARDGRLVWRYVPPLAGSARMRHHSDHVLPAMLSLARSFLGAGWSPDWLELDYPADAQAQRVEAWFGLPVRFGTGGIGLALPRAALAAASPRPGAAAGAVTRAELRAMLHPHPGEDPAGALEGVIGLRLLEGRSDIEGAAGMLGIGVRTLQRHLLRAGVSYRGLLEQARRRRAAHLLRETDREVIEIAVSLGYEEPGNFTRAFRRWTGMTPQGFRTAG